MAHIAGKFHNGGSFGFRGLERSFSNVQSSFSVRESGRGSIQSEIRAAVEVFRRPTVRTSSTRPIRQPPPPPATVQPVGILNDIIRNVAGGITGGAVAVRDINAQPQSGISNILNDFILGATTSRQERAATGRFRTGDFIKILERDVRRPVPGGRIGPGVPSHPAPVFSAAVQVGGMNEIIGLAAQNIARGAIGVSGGAMANGLRLVSPGVCPPGAQSFPPGTCLTDFQWEDAGSPRGFEIIGREGGNAILRKRGRRRRRRGLTATQMTQVQWACDLPAACRKSVLHGIVHA